MRAASRTRGLVGALEDIALLAVGAALGMLWQHAGGPFRVVPRTQLDVGKNIWEPFNVVLRTAGGVTLFAPSALSAGEGGHARS